MLIGAFGAILVAVSVVVALISAFAARDAVEATREAIADAQAARLEEARVACQTALLGAAAQALELFGDWARSGYDPEAAPAQLVRDPEKEQALVTQALETSVCRGARIIPQGSDLGFALDERINDLWFAVAENSVSSGEEANTCVVQAVSALEDALEQASSFVTDLRDHAASNLGLSDEEVREAELVDPPPSPDYLPETDRMSCTR